MARVLRRPAARGVYALATMVVLLALAACGSHGSAPQLGQSAHVALAWTSHPGSSPTGSGTRDSAGSATLTPFYATHFVVYKGASGIPYKSPATPLQLRDGDCGGPVIAPLTDNAPDLSGKQPPLVWPDGSGGVDVAITPSDQLWLTLLASAGANPTVLACGHPLSGDKQYFDLLSVTYDQGRLLLGHTLATALSEPIIASHVDVKLAQSASGPVAWAVHTGSCAGNTVASGQFTSNATTGGTLFEAPNMSDWWLSVTTGSGSSAHTACGKVSA